MPSEFDPAGLLEHLHEHGVKFVVIGGFAAWMHGAPVVTMDLDIVYEANEENATALVRALEALDATYRHHGDRKIVPTAGGLMSTEAAGHHLLRTRLGNLDALRTVAGMQYEDLVDDIVSIDIGGRVSPFASLLRIIELKEAAGRPKDLAALPTLRAALEETNNGE